MHRKVINDDFRSRITMLTLPLLNTMIFVQISSTTKKTHRYLIAYRLSSLSLKNVHLKKDNF